MKAHSTSKRDGRQYRLNSGMLVSAEIHLGTRTVMEYLVSPVSQTLHEAGREL
jgi:hemolysin D